MASREGNINSGPLKNKYLLCVSSSSCRVRVAHVWLGKTESGSCVLSQHSSIELQGCFPLCNLYQNLRSLLCFINLSYMFLQMLILLES